MEIREATLTDQEAIRNVHLNAFPKEESGLVSDLSIQLLTEKVHPPVISLVAESDNQIVGHIAFSPCMPDLENPPKIYILAPLGVVPTHQKTGIGSTLIKSGIEMLITKDVNTVLVYGDPNYYSRFGFNASDAKHFVPPFELTYPHGWLGRHLKNGSDPQQKINFCCVPSLQNPKLW